MLKTAVIFPDMHVPYEDKLSCDVAFQIAKSVNPDKIVQIGDFVDFYPISRYEKDPRRCSGFNLQLELDKAYEYLQRFSAIAPTIILEGNHEARLDKYLLKNAIGLYGLDNISVPAFLKTNSLNVDYRKDIYLGKLFLHHGDMKVKMGSKHSASSAQKTVEALGVSTMIGHVHKLGSYFKTTLGGGVQSGYEIGCLCNTDVEYMANPNWQHGIAVVRYEDTGAKRFYVDLVPIYGSEKGKGHKKREAYYNGHVYTAEG